MSNVSRRGLHPICPRRAGVLRGRRQRDVASHFERGTWLERLGRSAQQSGNPERSSFVHIAKALASAHLSIAAKIVCSAFCFLKGCLLSFGDQQNGLQRCSVRLQSNVTLHPTGGARG
jgi:hypothetical protein